MVFDIEDLFIQIVNMYVTDPKYDINTCTLHRITLYSTISKHHYQWMKKTNWFKEYKPVLLTMQWLCAQKITAKKSSYALDHNMIGSWANTLINPDDVKLAIKIYNMYCRGKLIFGDYPKYNISVNKIYPKYIYNLSDEYYKPNNSSYKYFQSKNNKIHMINATIDEKFEK